LASPDPPSTATWPSCPPRRPRRKPVLPVTRVVHMSTRQTATPCPRVRTGPMSEVAERPVYQASTGANVAPNSPAPPGPPVNSRSPIPEASAEHASIRGALDCRRCAGNPLRPSATTSRESSYATMGIVPHRPRHRRSPANKPKKSRRPQRIHHYH
jgi:hypothetical protein